MPLGYNVLIIPVWSIKEGLCSAQSPTQLQIKPPTFIKKEKKMRSLSTLIALLCVVVVFGGLSLSSNAQLDPSFYRNTCPKVHSIVREVVREVSKKDPRMLASLVRLHFHDCFVQVRILCFQMQIHHLITSN